MGVQMAGSKTEANTEKTTKSGTKSKRKLTFVSKLFPEILHLNCFGFRNLAILILLVRVCTHTHKHLNLSCVSLSQVIYCCLNKGVKKNE